MNWSMSYIFKGFLIIYYTFQIVKVRWKHIKLLLPTISKYENCNGFHLLPFTFKTTFCKCKSGKWVWHRSLVNEKWQTMSSIQRNSNSFVRMEMLIPKCKPLNYLKSEFMWIGCFENGTTCGVRWQIHKLSQLNAFIIIAILNYHYYNCERMCNKQTNTKNTHRKKLTLLGDGQSFITIKFCLNSVQLHQIACTWAAFECHCQNIFFLVVVHSQSTCELFSYNTRS